MSDFTIKDWKNADNDGGGDHSTPTNAEAWEDLERRLSDYTYDKTRFAALDKWSNE